MVISDDPVLHTTWSTATLAAAGLLGVLLALLWRNKAHYIPGVPYNADALPWLGDTLTLAKHRDHMLDWICEVYDKVGGTFQFSIPGEHYVCITDPESIKHVFYSNFDNYVKGRPIASRLEELLGGGIFTADGPSWLVQRKTASHMFKQSEFRDNMMVVFRRHITIVERVLDEAVSSQSYIDMHDLFLRYTLDSIGEIAFGTSIGSLQNPSTPFAAAFDSTQATIEKRFYNPLWRLTRLWRSDERRMRAGIAVMDRYTRDLIAKARADPTLAGRTDVLGRFMHLTNDAGQPALSEVELRDVVMNFIIAGRDTTGQAMSWMLYMLATHPECEARVCEEGRRVLGADLPEFEATKGLTYTNAAFTETLRLYPSVPKDLKFAVAADTLPNGVRVPAGTGVTVSAYLMGRMTSLWGADAAQYKPERHLSADGASLKPKESPYKFMAFQGGPRICLGQNMAYLEATTLVASLLRKYKFTLKPGYVPRPTTSVTLPMEGGLPMLVSRRPESS